MRTKTWIEEVVVKNNWKAEGMNELIGWIEPNSTDGYDVTMIDEGTFFTCETQENAEILATQQMILAILLRNQNVGDDI